jgi:hypothetical protein
VLAPYELGYADDGGLYIGVPNGESTISTRINGGSVLNDFSENIYRDNSGNFTIKVGIENLILSNLINSN